MATRSSAAALALTAALALAGCGGGGDKPDPEAARDAVASFTKAFGAGDGGTACDLLTRVGRAAIIRRTGERECSAAIEAIHSAAGSQVTGAYAAAKVSDVHVSGDRATARLSSGGFSTPVTLMKVDGDWRLAGVPGI